MPSQVQPVIHTSTKNMNIEPIKDRLNVLNTF